MFYAACNFVYVQIKGRYVYEFLTWSDPEQTIILCASITTVHLCLVLVLHGLSKGCLYFSKNEEEQELYHVLYSEIEEVHKV